MNRLPLTFHRSLQSPAHVFGRGKQAFWLLLLVFALSACASTENQATPAAANVPSLPALQHESAEQWLIQGRTRIDHVQHWWGRPSAQGISGDFSWYNYTYVGDAQSPTSQPGDTRMLSLTIYFVTATGLLADYDLQVHAFPAHMQSN